ITYDRREAGMSPMWVLGYLLSGERVPWSAQAQRCVSGRTRDLRSVQDSTKEIGIRYMSTVGRRLVAPVVLNQPMRIRLTLPFFRPSTRPPVYSGVDSKNGCLARNGSRRCARGPTWGTYRF